MVTRASPRWRSAWPRCWASRRTRPCGGSASTARTTPPARWPTPSPRSRPAYAHFQCTANGYGERPGNADLFAIVANLQLKLGLPVLPDGCLEQMVRVSHAIAEIANIAPDTHQAYVGAAAFAHKAGLHASAIKVDPVLYNHVDPAVVGNDMRILVTEMAGRASIELKSRELGLDLAGQPDALSRVTNRVKEMEAGGWSFEAADASFELLVRESCGEALGRRSRWSRTGCMVEHREDGAVVSEATVKVRVRGERVIATAEGNGPVNALDEALRVGAGPALPAAGRLRAGRLQGAHPGGLHGTGAVTRVLVETARRRRPGLDHGRRARERGRGELARAGRRAGLRPGPRPRLPHAAPRLEAVSPAEARGVARC